MIRFRPVPLAAFIALAVSACDSPSEPDAQFGVTGNGFPSGGHYNLNIIGVKHE